MMKNKKKICVIILILLVILIGVLIFYKVFVEKSNIDSPTKKYEDKYQYELGEENNSFEYKFLKEINVNNTNYLVSPLSVAYALSMLNDGAAGNTKKEITKTLNNYALSNIVNIPNRVGLANGLFIKNSYKNEINDSFINRLKNNYGAEVLYDKFDTPNVINDWAKEKTFNMIPKLLDKVSSSFVFGIANALAIDVEWKIPFDCSATHAEKFTKNDNHVIEAIMMHGKADSYFENNKAQGIVKDYMIYDKITGEKVFKKGDNTISLEYIAILPKGDLYSYINNFSKDELKTLLSNKKDVSDKLDIDISLPRYNYEYNLEQFKTNLINMGIKDVFDSSTSNLKPISNTLDLYVGIAVHKTHIELSEIGTKAAAATYFEIIDGMVLDEKEHKNIKFNKPFMYIIKEEDNDNILFVGTVYEPTLWQNNIEICK